MMTDGIKYECIKELTIQDGNGGYSTYEVGRVFESSAIIELSPEIIQEHFKIIR